jgi:hypothetical protein
MNEKQKNFFIEPEMSAYRNQILGVNRMEPRLELKTQAIQPMIEEVVRTKRAKTPSLALIARYSKANSRT